MGDKEEIIKDASEKIRIINRIDSDINKIASMSCVDGYTFDSVKKHCESLSKEEITEAVSLLQHFLIEKLVVKIRVYEKYIKDLEI